MNTIQTAIGYVRVSTEGQATEGVSMDAQKDRIGAWCLLNGYTLENVFVDAGLSGARADNRPELQSALDAVCRCRGVLVVYSLSRLARSTKDTLEISERLERAGADLASLSERIDTTTAAGKMIFRLLAVLSEFERDQIAERTCTALSHLRRQQRRISHRIPFGFDLAADGQTLTPNPAELSTVDRIRHARQSGRGLRDIAGELNSAGIAPKSGREWYASSIRSVLTADAKRSA